MSFKDAIDAELQQISSRLLALHEQAIAQVRREYRCTCAKDPPQLSIHRIDPVRPASPRGDDCESIMLTMPAVEAGELKVKEEERSAKEEVPPNRQVNGISEESSELPWTVSAKCPPGEISMEKMSAVVHIDCAYDLRDADNMLGQGTSDPYCICKVIGKTGAREFKTRTVSNTLNPMWNHIEDVALDEDVSEYILEFVVMDQDVGKSDDFLGRARLPLASCYPTGFNSRLPLDELGQAQVQVSVEFVSDDSERVAELLAQSREQWTTHDQQPQSLERGSSIAPTVSDLQKRSRYLMTGTGTLDQVVIAPTATLRLAWDALSSCFILFDAFTVPAAFGFDVQPSTGILIATCLVAIYWTLDIVANFFTGFIQHGVVETRFRLVAWKYMKGWFLIDMLVVVSDWVFIAVELGARSLFSPGSKLAKVSRAARAIKLISLIRAKKLSIYMPEIFRQYSEAMEISYHIGERLVAIMILTHLICCMWYGIGAADGETTTWVKQRGIESKSFLDRYVISLDWALAQFTPSPTDTHPQNLRERTFKICVDFCGLVTFSAFISTIMNRITRLRALKAKETQNKTLLWRYFAENRVPLYLSRRVLKAIHNREQEESSLQTCERDLAILQGLSGRLLQELRVQVKMPHCLIHPFFKFLHVCDAPALYEACHKYIQDRVVLRGHELFFRRVPAEHMIFIAKGRILYRSRATSVKVEQGGWLSEAAIWIRDWVHRGDALALKPGQILTLDAIQFQGLMMSRITWPQMYPEGIDKFIKIYVRNFIEEGEAALCGANTRLSCSDIWSGAKQLNIHSSCAFKSSGKADSGVTSRGRLSEYLRNQPASNTRAVSDFDATSSRQSV